MTEQRTFQRLTQRSVDEHRQIDFFLNQLLTTLDSLDADADDVEPLRRLAAQIDSLRERLEEHFQSEEHEGLFQAILDLLPDAHPAIHRLSAQHDRMIEILQMARIHAERGEPCEIEALRADLKTFLATMQDHERTEEELIKRAIQEEARALT